MTSEQMIEEILMEAHSMGFRQELIDRVMKIDIREDARKLVEVYEDTFRELFSEITD